MIIVTGAAGFIGSAVVAALNSRGIKNIILVDDSKRITPEKKHNMDKLSFDRFEDKEEFRERVIKSGFPERTSAVIHQGACSSTVERDMDYLMDTNYEYTRVLAEAALQDDVRFIYASSAATYGDGSLGFSDSHDMIEKLTPMNLYGESKQRFDLTALENGFLDRITGLKYFNVYGPNEYHKGEMRSFVIKSFEQIMESGEVGLFKSYRPDYGDGEQVRDFIYVKDAVRMTLFFLDNPDVAGIYNIGTGRPRTWNSLVAAVFGAMGREENIRYIEMPDNIQGQYQYYTCADMGKLKTAGCDIGTISLEKSIQDYVRNYLTAHEHIGSRDVFSTS